MKTAEETIKLAKMIESHGVAMLTVHGRTRHHNKQFMGPCNWDIIKQIKDTLRIPVIANGGIENYQDALDCLKYTGCDGVMSSESALEYPALFNGHEIVDNDKLANEYLDLAAELGNADMSWIRAHIHKFLHFGFKTHTDLRDKLNTSKTIPEIKEIAEEL